MNLHGKPSTQLTINRVSGAMWGAMVEYTGIVGDDSYVKTIQQGLTANYGPAHDFILDYKRDQTV